MKHTLNSFFDTDTLDLRGAPTSTYVEHLHPAHSRGKATLMHIQAGRRTFSRTHPPADLPDQVGYWLEGAGYVSLNRFFGPRRVDKLAELNAVYIDIDVYNSSLLANVPRQEIPFHLALHWASLRLPTPSMLVDTGRGFAAVWLIQPLPAQAHPRWSYFQRELVAASRAIGADPACTDAARVFRLPGSWNGKAGRTVTLVAGDGVRHDFDALADSFYASVGRPTRAKLNAKKQKRANRKAHNATEPRGLPPATRFRLIFNDLLRLRDHWSGQIPVGYRNTWLHMCATCLSHFDDPANITDRVDDLAAATSGLSASEVRAVANSATRRAEKALASNGATTLDDGRLHYSGAEIAMRLDVSDELAEALSLEQIYSESRRKTLQRQRDENRRRAAGILRREDWLKLNGNEKSQPWRKAGISRATWYRHRSAESQKQKDASLGTTNTPNDSETGRVSLQGA